MNKLLVVGASGVIGSALVEYAAGLPDWQVYALSRRAPLLGSDVGAVTHLPLDLTDASRCAETLQSLKSTFTHVVYAAVAEKPGLVSGWSDPALMQDNLCMLQNVLEPLAGSRTLRHVAIMQGTKAYGAHMHAVTLPLIEDAPRDPHPNFYWLHEDFLRTMSDREGWSWTVFRPQVVLGGAHGVVMNPVPVIGAYAAICREEGSPCGFPGTHTALWEATDAHLIAQACIWAADAAEARNQIFNVTNGDIWVLGHQWPEICTMLGVALGPPSPVNFVDFLNEKSVVWDRIVRKANLRPISLAALFGESHHYLNLLLGNGRPTAPWPPALVSTIKIRQAGFTACVRTVDSMRNWLAALAQRRVLPPA